VKGERWLHEFVICHSARSSISYPPRLFGYWLLAIGIPSQPGAVVEVDRNQEEDSFDHVERHIGDGEAKQKPEWA